MATVVEAEEVAQESTGGTMAEPIIIDLGKKKRKRVKRLRKGRGRLVDNVYDAVDRLRERGEIAADAQPVIVIVRQKRRGGRYRFF